MIGPFEEFLLTMLQVVAVGLTHGSGQGKIH